MKCKNIRRDTIGYRYSINTYIFGEVYHTYISDRLHSFGINPKYSRNFLLEENALNYHYGMLEKFKKEQGITK